MVYVVLIVGLVAVGVVGWSLGSRAAYESAEYTVVESDGKFEIREYPDLMLASTESVLDSQGRDGSFMRLFRYISGANESEQKIAMTTPVFMENESAGASNEEQAATGEADTAQGDRYDTQMGFVLPKEVAASGVPNPVGPNVSIRKRDGGRFAVVRFSGVLNQKSATAAEAKLREWMNSNGLTGSQSAESAGYDPPFTPGFLRRNEVLIRLL